MICGIVGRVLDKYEKSFIAKDGKEIEYTGISILDDDAFMDSDRVFGLRTSTQLGKEVAVGETYKFTGNLTTDRGVLKFKCNSVTPAK